MPDPAALATLQQALATSVAAEQLLATALDLQREATQILEMAIVECDEEISGQQSREAAPEPGTRKQSTAERLAAARFKLATCGQLSDDYKMEIEQTLDEAQRVIDRSHDHADAA